MKEVAEGLEGARQGVEGRKEEEVCQRLPWSFMFVVPLDHSRG